MKRLVCMMMSLGIMCLLAGQTFAQTETKPETPPSVETPEKSPEPATPEQPEAPKEDPNKVVVVVNGKEIKLADLDAQIAKMIDKDKRFQELPPDTQAMYREQFRKSMASMMVEIMLLEDAAKELGIEVTQKDVDDYVKGNLQQHLRVGTRGLNLDQFKKEFEISQGIDLDEAIKMQKTNPRTRMQVVQFKMIDKKGEDKLEITDEEVNTRYEEQKTRFDYPEMVAARHILLKLPPEIAEAQREMNQKVREIQDAAKPEEGTEMSEEKKAEVDAEVEKVKAEGEKKIEELKASVLAKLKDIETKAKAEGADFAKLAEEYSDCPSKSNGGYLKYFTREQMVPPFSEAAFSMKVGEISEPVETQFGYHIIKVDDHKQASTAPEDVAKAAIRYDLLNQKRMKAWSEVFGDNYIQDLKAKADIQYKDPSYEPPKPRVAPKPRVSPDKAPVPPKPAESKKTEEPQKDVPKAPEPPAPSQDK